jgi:hypothetical protein
MLIADSGPKPRRRKRRKPSEGAATETQPE